MDRINLDVSTTVIRLSTCITVFGYEVIPSFDGNIL